jgi:16S rRNA (guanine966-N2)-methyltransferase
VLGAKANGGPFGGTAAHVVSVLGQIDAHEQIPFVAELKNARARLERRIDAIDENEDGFEAVAEDLLPLLKIGDVLLGGPGFKSRAGGAIAAGSAFDIHQQIRPFLAVNHEVKGFQLGVGEEGFFGFIDSDIRNGAMTQVGFEGGFVMDGSVGHSAKRIVAGIGISATFDVMRIIAGEFRGRKLLPPVGEVTRPITDRVKQSLFDVLSPRMENARVYDCFSGTGSMGLECLSRGAAHVTLFETDRSAIDRLKQNIQTLGVKERTTVIAKDLFRWFGQTERAEQKADLIFLDPPYRFLRERPSELQILVRILSHGHMAPDAQVIFRHDADDSLSLEPLKVIDVRTYGSMALEFLTG